MYSSLQVLNMIRFNNLLFILFDLSANLLATLTVVNLAIFSVRLLKMLSAKSSYLFRKSWQHFRVRLFFHTLLTLISLYLNMIGGPFKHER